MSCTSWKFQPKVCVYSLCQICPQGAKFRTKKCWGEYCFLKCALCQSGVWCNWLIILVDDFLGLPQCSIWHICEKMYGVMKWILRFQIKGPIPALFWYRERIYELSLAEDMYIVGIWGSPKCAFCIASGSLCRCFLRLKIVSP